MNISPNKFVQMHLKIKNGIIRDIFDSESLCIESESFTHDYGSYWIYPGFTDSHGHVAGLGAKLLSSGLHDARSLEECLGIIGGASPNRGEWLVGYGWNEENWECGSYPDKKFLDSMFPDIPVVMYRIDGHALWVNSKALEIAGIRRNSGSIAGGEIKFDKSGSPIGILIDNAIYPVTRKLPAYSVGQSKNIIKSALAELASKGITEVHDMDVSPELITIYKELDEAGHLPIRLNSFIAAQQDEYLEAIAEPHSGRNFNVVGIKFYMDGALGSRGAAMLQDYADMPGHRGLVLIGKEELSRKINKGASTGFAIAVHAIGDAANRMILDIYGQLRQQNTIPENTILRVEHAQHIHRLDLDKFRKYGIFAALQPVHCTSDAPMARKRLGSTNTLHYPWKSLIEAGALIGGGSDFPIESHDPLAGIDAFVNRTPKDETLPWMPEECISFSQALESYTLNGQKIAGQKNRGKLKTGYDADFVILDKDISKDNKRITDAEVVAVYCGGRLVYKKDSKWQIR